MADKFFDSSVTDIATAVVGVTLVADFLLFAAFFRRVFSSSFFNLAASFDLNFAAFLWTLILRFSFCNFALALRFRS